MPTDRVRRSKKADEFDIVVIPVGQGGKSRTYRFTKSRLWFLGLGLVLAVALFTLAGLIFTPLALVVPIPNSILEEKYGRQLLETQKELQALAQEVLRLGDYNRKLRVVLGDDPDSSMQGVESSPDFSDQNFSQDLTLAPFSDDFIPSLDRGEEFSTVLVGGTIHRVVFPMVNPVSGIISQRFDSERLHFGVDYASKLGTPVFAAAEGYVLFSGWTPDDGNMAMISHGGGYLTVYKHNQSLLKSAHTTVKRGEMVALLGSSGQTSTGPHLHFEVWKDGVPVDPEEYLLLSTPVQNQ